MKDLYHTKSKRTHMFIEILFLIPYWIYFIIDHSFREAFFRLSWSKEQMESFELKRIQVIVTYAYENSLFYKKLYDEAGVSPQDLKTLQDIEKFPILTKKDLRRAIADGTIFTQNKIPKWTSKTSTTGSSGDPLVLYFDIGARRQRFINKARSLMLIGLYPHKRFGLLWRRKALSKRQKFASKMGIFRWFSVVDVRNAQVEAFDDEKLKKIVNDIIVFQPEVVMGYTSALRVLAKLVKRGNLPFYPERIISAGEYLPPIWRNEMEETFKCPVHNLYGGTEASPIAASINGHSELAVFQDFYFSEVVNSKGNNVGNGETGRILITDYHSKYMPLIRYEVGDIAEWANMLVGPFPAFKEVQGRINDIFVLPGNKLLFSHNWHIYFRDIKSISKFKAIQRSINYIEIFLETSENDWNDDLRLAKERVESALGDDITYKWHFVKQLDVDPGDKFRSVRSEVDSSAIIDNL